MTRCETTAPLVNLKEADEVSDIYNTVADRVRGLLENMIDNPVATKLLEQGITRSLVKRNVMTWAYSSKKFGMVNQVVEDTMAPLADDVLRGKLEFHPYALEGDKRGGYQAAKLLGHTTFDAIESIVSRPAEAMRFLQGISRTLAHEGKPAVWHTPMGLPVVLRYAPKTINRLHLYLQDRGVTREMRVNVASFEPGIDKVRAANAIAPGFVHSMDACHLQMVVNSAAAFGINSVALVHDSFGCHAADAKRFRGVILQTFHDLYDHNDVLRNILNEAWEQVETNHHRLPVLPLMGSYQMREVLNARYAFA
jgi:DNA-directed RNA polymerase